MSQRSTDVAPHDHVVSFYDGDEDALAAVVPYVAEGLSRGEPALVVATPEHLDAVDAALVAAGLDVGSLRAQGRWHTLDAASTLASFMVGRMPDPVRFRQVVGGVIDGVIGGVIGGASGGASAGASPLRVFGEMVALLWDEDNVAAALVLEECWNQLAATRSFTLLCAYPHDVLDRVSLAEVGAVCRLHSEVLAPPSYHPSQHDAGDAAGSRTTGPPADAHASWAFLPVPRAIPALRRFVTRTLAGWGEDALAGDAELVAAELATNAIQHADSPFHATIRRHDGVVRMSIEDAGPGSAQQRVAEEDELSGRGLLLVEALTLRWGHSPLPTGKAVWVELGSTVR